MDFNFFFLPDMLGISQLKSKPKTITDMMNNDKILREYNTNHQDNLFKKTNKQKTSEKSKQHQTTASAIRTELFDSDSEQVIIFSNFSPQITISISKYNNKNSVFSVKPIGYFFDVISYTYNSFFQSKSNP